ncbi:MAG: hypothetical protein M1368_11960 [Thaumarchaeota archaeon]|nr:hypothetical protein [Nitrososphaerota archaeon]
MSGASNDETKDDNSSRNKTFQSKSANKEPADKRPNNLAAGPESQRGTAQSEDKAISVAPALQKIAPAPPPTAKAPSVPIIHKVTKQEISRRNFMKGLVLLGGVIAAS